MNEVFTFSLDFRILCRCQWSQKVMTKDKFSFHQTCRSKFSVKAISSWFHFPKSWKLEAKPDALFETLIFTVSQIGFTYNGFHAHTLLLFAPWAQIQKKKRATDGNSSPGRMLKEKL